MANLEFDGNDVRCEMKEVIPATKTAKTKVGGSANAAGDLWFLDTANRFETYPVAKVDLDIQSRGASHPHVGSFAPGVSHGPITLQGSIEIKQRLGTKLFGAALGQSKTGVADADLEWANMSADGSGVFDGAEVTNLEKQRANFAIKLTVGVESQTKPIIMYIKDVQLLGPKTGINMDGADVLIVPFQATFMFAKYLKAGYA